MSTALATTERKSILAAVAARYEMEPQAFEAVLRNTVAKPDKTGREITREEFAACLVVAQQYNLNPLTKEIYFFPDPKRGGIVPVLGVDGWARIINENPHFDGMEFVTEWNDNGKPVAVTCTMFRKDRSRPITVTEYLSECSRDTDPWKKSPARMLRHKAMIQCARYAFGFAGLYDEDDAASMIDVTPPKAQRAPAPMTIVSAEPQPESAAKVERRRAPKPGAAGNEPAPSPAKGEGDAAPADDADDQRPAESGQDNAAPADDPVLDAAREMAMEGAKRFKLWLGKQTDDVLKHLEPHMAKLNEAAQQAGA